MRTRDIIITAVTAMSLVAAVNLAGVRWVFEDAAAGKVPEGWSVHTTGKGPDGVWKVVEDTSAKSGIQVLAQLSSKGPKKLFNLCVCDESNLKDLEVSVAVKAVKGKVDQGGGPVWRYKDKDNYYVARVNPLEKNFRVYKVVNGQPTQLRSANVKAPADEWHTIRVTHKGDHIQCYLNGKLHLDVRDKTFTEIGPVGLWTKADAVTSFDDFAYADI